MQRTIRQGLEVATRRSFTTSTCWCDSSSTRYSLPQDAFSSSSPPSTSSTPSTTTSSYSRSRSPLASIPSSSSSTTLPPSSGRQRQKQFLTDSEAQAFADLLGEILPKSLASMPPAAGNKSPTRSGSGGGVFDLFGPNPSTTPEGEGISEIQTALQRKFERKQRATSKGSLGRDQYVKGRGELTEEEEFELDRFKEESMSLRDDHELFQWGLEKVFGVAPSRSRSIFIDPEALPTATATTLISSTSKKVGPASRLYPDLLLHLFLTLRDNHDSPHTALKIFSLASSNAHSYISGCTSRLYYEVLMTRWIHSGASDIEGVLKGLEEMQVGGVRVGQEEEKLKGLVGEIGELIRNDRERTELQVRYLEEKGEFGGKLDEGEFEREVGKRRWYGDKDIRDWRRMEGMLEDNLDESEEKRRSERRRRDEEEEKERIRLEKQREVRERIEWEKELKRNGGERDFGSREEDSLRGERFESRFQERVEREEERPTLYSHREPAGGGRSSTSTHSHPSTRRSGLSPFENVPKPPRGDSLNDRRRPDHDREADSDYERSLGWKERDQLKGLPKRPSFANVYKIRRQSLTKAEKSRKDEKHPMLFWKGK